MTLRIVNATKDEIEAMMGDDQLEIAKKVADRFAEDCGHREQFIVVHEIVVHETPLKDKAL
jgi:hypothetical protein